MFGIVFSFLTLQKFNLRIEDSVLTGMRDSHTDFSATLQCFHIDTKFSPPNFGLVEAEGNEAGSILFAWVVG